MQRPVCVGQLVGARQAGLGAIEQSQRAPRVEQVGDGFTVARADILAHQTERAGNLNGARLRLQLGLDQTQKRRLAGAVAPYDAGALRAET